MVHLRWILLSCLAAVLILLSVTGESSCESSSSLSSSPEESTSGETRPGLLDNRRLKDSFSDTPHPSIRRKRKCPFKSSKKLPIRNQQISPRNNKRLQTPTKNKHKCPFGIKKRVPTKKKTKCSIRRNWATFTSNKPKYPFSQKVPAKNFPFSRNFRVTVRKRPNVTFSKKSKCRIRSNQKATVRKKAKCPLKKNLATNISNKPTGPFSKHRSAPIKKQTKCPLSKIQTAIRKTPKCPFSKHHQVSVDNKQRNPLRTTQKVSGKKKTEYQYKRIMIGTNHRNPKCPLRKNPKGLDQKKTEKCPFSENANVGVNNKPKCPFSKYRKAPVKKNSKCPLKKNLLVAIKEMTRSPPQHPARKTVRTIHKQVSFSSIRRTEPLRNKPKLLPSNNPEDSLRKKTKLSVANKIPAVPSSSKSKCPSEMPPFKKPTQLKTKEVVPLSAKRELSNREKMDILINYQIRLFISLRFASCVPCRRRLAFQPIFPSLFPIYFTTPSFQDLLGAPSASSLFESTICEGNLGQFQCPNGEKIQIESAFYGRQNLHECMLFSMYGKKQDTNCRRDVTAIVSDMCNNRTLCYIYVDNEEMRGDPCPNTYKYMHFTASCV